MKNYFYISVTMLFLSVAQMAFTQVTKGPTEPIDEYIIKCEAIDYDDVDLLYSASSSDIYKEANNTSNWYLKVEEFIKTETDGQFIKGQFYDGMRGGGPLGFFVPEDKKDSYFDEKLGRKTWFIRSNQWHCFFSARTNLWLQKVRQKRKEKREGITND